MKKIFFLIICLLFVNNVSASTCHLIDSGTIAGISAGSLSYSSPSSLLSVNYGSYYSAYTTINGAVINDTSIIQELNTIYFDLCVSKPKFSVTVYHPSCINSCMDNPVTVTGLDLECTMNLYDTYLESNREVDGYVARVFVPVKKWQLLSGDPQSIYVDDTIRINNTEENSSSPLYFKFLNTPYLCDYDPSVSYAQAYGTKDDLNRNFANLPDLAANEDFIQNNGSCVESYNLLGTSVYNSSYFNKSTDVLTITPSSLTKYRYFDKTNIFEPQSVTNSGNNGLTVTQHSNGSITVNGTNTSGSNVNLLLGYFYSVTGKNYTLSGSLNGGYGIYRLWADQNAVFPSTGRLYSDNGPVTAKAMADRSVPIYLIIYPNATLNNVTFYPMVNEGNYYGKYVPYSLPGLKLTDLHFHNNNVRFRFYNSNITSSDNIYLVGYHSNQDTVYYNNLLNCNQINGKCTFIDNFNLPNIIFNKTNNYINGLYMLFDTDNTITFDKPFLYDSDKVPKTFSSAPFYIAPKKYFCFDDTNGVYYYSFDKTIVYNSNNPINYGPTDYFFGFKSYDPNGITGIVTAPVEFLHSLTGSCSPISFTIFRKNISLPCGDTLFWNRSDVSTFRAFWNTLFGGSILYGFVIYLFKVIERIRDPKSNKVEVLDDK